MSHLENERRDENGTGKRRVEDMLSRGLMLGIGKSASLGWYDIKGFDPALKQADSSKFVISCGPDEFEYVHRQTLTHTQCAAAENMNDEIRVVVQIISRPN